MLSYTVYYAKSLPAVKAIVESFDWPGILVTQAKLLLLLHDHFRGMGAWRKTMEHQKPGNFPGPGPEVVERQRVAKE